MDWKQRVDTLMPPNFRRDVRFRLEYAVFWIIVGLIRLFPMAIATAFFARASRAYSVGSRRHRRALLNLRRAFPEKTAAEHEEIACAMWENVGRVIAESFHLDKIVAEPHRLDNLDTRGLDALQSGDREIYVSLHTGNWELGLLPLVERQYKPAAFYRVVVNPYVDRYIRRLRERVYPGGMFAVRRESAGGGRTSETTSRAIVACLRQGTPIGLLVDHFDHDGILVPFFGREVRVSRVPATLAFQFRSKLIVARSVRIGTSSTFLAEGVELSLLETGNRHADIAATTRAIYRQMEEWIRQYPEQWLWAQAPFAASIEADLPLSAHQPAAAGMTP